MSGASAAVQSRGAPANRLRKALTRYVVMGLVIFSVLRFVSGRADWWRAWAYVGMTLTIQVIVGIILNRVHPDLLAERSKMQKGTKRWDKVLVPIVAFAGPLAMWVVAAWDVRVHWPPAVPLVWSGLGFAVCFLGSWITAAAMRANRFFSATVRIQEERGHVVVDSGPYAHVRHPGYIGAMAFTIGTPAAIGSWLAMIPAGITAAVLVLRTALEDRTLRAELPGYEEYARRVRSRLLPGIW